MPIRTKNYKDLDFVVGVRTNSGAWLEVHALRDATTPLSKRAMEKTVEALMRQKDVPVLVNHDSKGGD